MGQKEKNCPGTPFPLAVLLMICTCLLTGRNLLSVTQHGSLKFNWPFDYHRVLRWICTNMINRSFTRPGNLVRVVFTIHHTWYAGISFASLASLHPAYSNNEFAMISGERRCGGRRLGPWCKTRAIGLVQRYGLVLYKGMEFKNNSASRGGKLDTPRVS